jgi:hypothetical protein
MDSRHDKAIEAVLEQLIEHGPEGIATVFARTFEMAMLIESEWFLGAGHNERTPDRRGDAIGMTNCFIVHSGSVTIPGNPVKRHYLVSAIRWIAMIADRQ